MKVVISSPFRSNTKIVLSLGDSVAEILMTGITLRTPSEYLKSISGTYGVYNGVADVILSLSFHTNLSTYVPFGRPSNTGTPFTIPMEDSVVVGFHGRAGYYLDAIGIYVKPLNPRGSISLGTWGGPKGDPFGFMVGTTSWIKQIIIRHDSNIKALSFKDENDHNYGIFGGKNPNDLGREAIIEFDGRSEFLTSISGTNGSYVNYASVITSLLFETNLNTYGPFGREIGTTFSLPIMRGAVVVGFHGKSNIYIDSIGIYVRPAATLLISAPITFLEGFRESITLPMAEISTTGQPAPTDRLLNGRIPVDYFGELIVS
ncbi:hypothetical protein CsatB_021516 [Cannabis sativa]